MRTQLKILPGISLSQLLDSHLSMLNRNDDEHTLCIHTLIPVFIFITAYNLYA